MLQPWWKLSELTLADLEAQAENAEYVKNAQTDNMRIMHKMTKWQDAQYATYTNMMAYNVMQKNPKIRAKNQNRLSYYENSAPEKTDLSIELIWILPSQGASHLPDFKVWAPKEWSSTWPNQVRFT